MPAKDTLESIRKRIADTGDKLSDEFTKYNNGDEKIPILCQHCNKIYRNVSWNNWKFRGTRCSCQTLKKKREKRVMPYAKFLKALTDEGYTTNYDGKDYSGYRHVIWVQCPDKHYEFETYYDNFVNRERRCPDVSHRGTDRNIIEKEFDKKFKTTHESIIYRTNKKFGENRYKFINLPQNVKMIDIIKIQCLICEHEFNRRLSDFFNNKSKCGCPICYLKERTTTKEDFLEKNKIRYGELYDCSNFIYVNNRTKGDIKCNVCENIFQQTPDNFINQKCGCYYCSQTSGEKDVMNYLKNNKIKFKAQEPFGRMRFDFFLPEYNAYIEFDGQQHFEHIEHFGSYENFLKQRERDQIKNNFCYGRFPLLRIPYYDQDKINDILNKFFQNLNELRKLRNQIKKFINKKYEKPNEPRKRFELVVIRAHNIENHKEILENYIKLHIELYLPNY